MSNTESTTLPIKVRSSRIHGKGAFATVALAPGARIGPYEGHRYSADEAAERDWDQALTFVFGLSDGSVIDGSRGGNATRHINHSCAPNCVAYEMEPEEGESWIEIEALVRIEAGAELFLDYQLDAGDSQAEDFRCACGTAACRNTMIAVPA